MPRRAESTAPRPAVHARRSQVDRTERAGAALRAAALDLMLNDGIEHVTLASVGEAAGYSRGIVSYHFGTKEGLLSNLLATMLKDSKAVFTQPSVDGVAALLAILKTYQDYVQTHPREALAQILLLNEAASSAGTELNELARTYNAAMRAAVERHLDSERRLIRERLSLTPHDAAALFVGALRGINHQWLAERDTFDIAQAIGGLRRAVSKLASDRAPSRPRRDRTSSMDRKNGRQSDE